jgi:hypothetical protein
MSEGWRYEWNYFTREAEAAHVLKGCNQMIEIFRWIFNEYYIIRSWYLMKGRILISNFNYVHSGPSYLSDYNEAAQHTQQKDPPPKQLRRKEVTKPD